MSEAKQTRTVTININEKEYVVPADRSVIQACHDNGISVPHYCYHQDLSVAGNCRMCLVRAKGIPKPIIACATAVADGMEIDTKSEDVEKDRQAIMEFLLINHPLDCPECDQAGECRLQDYSYNYGRDHGRFKEQKITRKKATFGPHVKYWGSRCIVCTRCVRFTDEVSGTGELAVISRGDHSEIAVFPGKTLDNPLSMNTVDICPVGALVSSDFLYRQRAWWLHKKPSVCPDCSVGCNTRVDSDDKNDIKRIQPRRNDAVNKEWMCDYGRISFPYVYQYRLGAPLRESGGEIEWPEAIDRAAGYLQRSDDVLLLASAWTTNEGLEQAKSLAESLGARLSAIANPVQEDEVFPGFLISGDKNPNRRGVQDILGIEDIEAHLAEQKPARTVLVIGQIPDFHPGDHLFNLLDGASEIIALDFYRSHFVEHENCVLVLPGLTHFEKSGSFTNRQGLRQSFEPALERSVNPDGRSEAEILAELRREVEAPETAGKS